MADPSDDDGAGELPRWYLPEWLATTGKKQADVVRSTGWGKGRVSQLVTGKRTVTLEVVHQVAASIGIEPHELLMPPLEAMALRRLRESARSIAADRTVYRPPPPERRN